MSNDDGPTVRMSAYCPLVYVRRSRITQFFPAEFLGVFDPIDGCEERTVDATVGCTCRFLWKKKLIFGLFWLRGVTLSPPS